MKLIEETPSKLLFFQIGDKLFLRTLFDEQNQVLYMTWYGFVPIDEIINAYIILGRHNKKNGFIVLKALVDLTSFEGGFEEHNDWMVREYWVKAMQYGYSQTAFVKSNDYTTNLSLIFLKDENEQYLKEHEIRIFETAEEAEKWLKN